MTYWSTQEDCRYQIDSTVEENNTLNGLDNNLTMLYGFTLNALLLASTATATGPAVATAANRSDSLPLEILTLPEIHAPMLFLLNAHDDCYKQ